MADRYWVGDTGNWSDNTNHWSASSGGAANASKPTSADSVYFDASSFTTGSQTVTLDEIAYCLDMDWTGATNTPTLAGAKEMRVYGSFTSIAAMVWSTTKYLEFRATTTGKTITTNGLSLYRIDFRNVDGGWTLQDDVTTTSTFALSFGSLDTNGKTITCGDQFYISGTAARTLTLGASVINCAFGWVATDTTNLTLDEGTSSIRVTGTGAFDGGGETYYEVQLNGTAHTITGSNTFTNLKLLPAGIQTITFTDGTTQTVTSFTRSAGTSVITLQGSSTAGWTISKASGYVVLDYLSISYSTAAGGAAFNAGSHSTDGGNNTGWFFQEEFHPAVWDNFTWG